MATYKVIQDIEAEDKLLGPLTLRQFIYACIALACAYFMFLSLTRNASIMILFLLPPFLFFGFLAWPFSRDQPTEVWVLAKLRFMFKPRRRIWDQSGLKQLVTITAPKVDEKTYTDGLSQGEVRSRLQALANTLDSRGWAVKNMNVNLFANPQYAMAGSSDRLIDPASLPREVNNFDITSSDDIMDADNNLTAQNLDRMINATSETHRQQILEQMRQAGGSSTQQPADYWFMNQTSGPVPSGQAVFDPSSAILPGTATSSTSTGPATSDEKALLEKLHAKPKGNAAYGHMKTINPPGEGPAPATSTPAPAASKPVEPQRPESSRKTPDPAILELAHNDDLNVATIARQANKQKGQSDDGEVVISLR